MRKLLKERMVFKLFFILFVSIGVPITIFSIFSYYMSYQNIRDEFIESKTSLNKQIAENVSENFYVLKSQSIALYNYDNIAYIINANKENLTSEYIENYNLVYANLVSMIQGNFKLDSISIIDLEGEVKFYYDRNMAIQNLNDVVKEEWFQATIDAHGRAIVVAPHQNVFTNTSAEVVSICRVIVDPYDDKIVGVLKIDQSVNTFERIFANTEKEDGEINIVYDQDGNLFYSNEEVDESNAKGIVTYGESSKDMWRVVSILDSKAVAQKALFIRQINTLLTIGLFVVCAGIAVLVSYTINSPIQKLIVSIKRFQEGDMETQVELNRSDEFGSIADAFNDMTKHIQKLINEEYKMELLKKQAEFENYQSQINPHFLFNTLNSIKAVSMKENSEKTAEMIQYLSDNFRYSLNRGKYIVPFAEELEYIKKYFALQQMRFSNKYVIEIDVDEAVLDNMIPRMILQPIVENAFVHGLEASTKIGEIRIVAQNIGEECIIYISNTGKMISKEKLNEINVNLEIKDDQQYYLQNKDKVGVYNVNARIRYHYGENYGLKFINNDDGLTIVKICIPKVKGTL